jgi:hypothetical protein
MRNGAIASEYARFLRIPTLLKLTLMEGRERYCSNERALAVLFERKLEFLLASAGDNFDSPGNHHERLFSSANP